MSPRTNRIALFIDGYNLNATSKMLGFDIDFRRLLNEFERHGELLRAFYYTTIVEEQNSTLRPLIDWLGSNGYTTVTKATTDSFDSNSRRGFNGRINVDLAVGALELANKVDEIVLFSGDGDYRRLVAAIQRRGVRVCVVSTISSRPPMIADELRRQADAFIDLLALRPLVARTQER
jgi:uncharacterized LabA/DUF88 family protein